MIEWVDTQTHRIYCEIILLFLGFYVTVFRWAVEQQFLICTALTVCNDINSAPPSMDGDQSVNYHLICNESGQVSISVRIDFYLKHKSVIWAKFHWTFRTRVKFCEWKSLNRVNVWWWVPFIRLRYSNEWNYHIATVDNHFGFTWELIKLKIVQLDAQWA